MIRHTSLPVVSWAWIIAEALKLMNIIIIEKEDLDDVNAKKISWQVTGRADLADEVSLGRAEWKVKWGILCGITTS